MTPPMIGRQQEQEALLDVLNGDPGQGSAAVVTGSAGVGKSRLLTEVLPADRVLVWVSFPARRLGEPGFGLRRLADLPAAQALKKELAASRSSDKSRSQRIVAAADEVVASSPDQIVVLEDAQWMDGLTSAWVAHLPELLAVHPVRIVVAARSDAQSGLPPVVGALLESDLARRIDVEPLSKAELREMARSYGFDPDPRFLDKLAQRTGGIPLVAEEILTRLHPTGSEMSRRAVSELTGLIGLVRDMLERADEATRLVAAAASITTRADDDELMQRITKLDERDLHAARRKLADQGLFNSRHQGFTHEVHRDMVRKEIPTQDARLLHRALVDELQKRSGVPAAEIAEHLLEAGAAEEAIPWLERAGDEALATHDLGGALTALKAAFTSTGPGDHGLRVRLAEKITAIARTADQPAAAVEIVDEALAPSTGSHRASLLMCRAQLAQEMGDLSTRLEALMEARDEFRSLGDDAALARVLAALTLPLGKVMSLEERLSLGREGLRIASACGDAIGVAQCAGNLAAVEISLGHASAFDLWNTALDALADRKNPEAVQESLRARANFAIGALAYGSYGRAERILRGGIDVARRNNDTHWRRSFELFESLLLWRTGRWDEALTRMADLEYVHRYDAAYSEALRAAIAFERDEEPELAPLIEATDLLARYSAHGAGAVTYSILMQIRAVRGEPVPARGVVDLAGRIAATEVRIGWDDVLPATAGVDRAAYSRLLNALGPLRPEGPRGAASMTFAEGLIAARDGTPQAVELLADAADRFGAIGQPYSMAQAQAAAARAAPQGKSVALFVEAAAAYDDLGAWRSLARLLRDAPRSRHLDRFRANAPRTAARWTLTEREREIATLAARGYTSPEIAWELTLSVRTIEKHVERIRTKLGVKRKSDLVRMFHEAPS